jgi:serine/threonine-protein kinase RsbW
MKRALQSARNLEFASHPANLALVREFVRAFLLTLPFPQRERDLMVLGIDEACTNIIRHAYHQRSDQLIRLGCEHHQAGALFRLRDFGTQSDPLALEGRSLEVLQPGGLGMHLIKRAFDDVEYRLKNRGTEWIATKLFPAPVRGSVDATG